GGDRRRGGRWQSRWSLCRLLTGRTMRLPGETRKRLRVAGAFVRWRNGLGCPLIPCGAIAWPCIGEHDTQPQEAQQQQRIEKQVRYHGKVPLTRWRKGGILPDFQATKLGVSHLLHSKYSANPLPLQKKQHLSEKSGIT